MHIYIPMSAGSRPRAIDPKSYTLRDLLLVTQIMHTKGLIQPDQVLASDQLEDVSQEWFSHIGSVVSRNQMQFPIEKALSPTQLGKLYGNMLQDNEHCKNTTDLANAFYFARIAELELKIASAKTDFLLALHNLAPQ